MVLSNSVPSNRCVEGSVLVCGFINAGHAVETLEIKPIKKKALTALFVDISIN